MTSRQVVETSVTNNSSFQNYTHPDDHTIRTKYFSLAGGKLKEIRMKKKKLEEAWNQTWSVGEFSFLIVSHVLAS